MEIPSKLQKEIEAYCTANNIKDVNKFVVKILTQGFNIEKYGMKPEVKTKPKAKEESESETKPIPEEKPKVKRVTKKTIKEPIDKYKDLYDED